MDLKIRIRPAKSEDAEKLLAIYAPYVEQTAITFEYEVPTVEEFRERIHNTLKKYPYLVAEQGGEPVGYAYVGPFHDRPAYDWAVETSIYMGEQYRKIGGGRLLHEGLEEALRLQGIRNMNACIASTQESAMNAPWLPSTAANSIPPLCGRSSPSRGLRNLSSAPRRRTRPSRP